MALGIIKGINIISQSARWHTFIIDLKRERTNSDQIKIREFLFLSEIRENELG